MSTKNYTDLLYWEDRALTPTAHATEQSVKSGLPLPYSLPPGYYRLADCIEGLDGSAIVTFKVLGSDPYFIVLNQDAAIVTVYRANGKHYVAMQRKYHQKGRKK